MSPLERLIQPLAHRVRLMVGRAVIAAVNDGATAQLLQLDVLAGESHDDVERFQTYGHTSVPLPGAEALVVYVGGLRSHGVVVAVEDRRHRPQGMQPGENALYDDQRQMVLIGRDGIRVTSPKKVEVHAPSVSVTADKVDLGGEGGKGIARIGDKVANGVIVQGSDKVFSG